VERIPERPKLVSRALDVLDVLAGLVLASVRRLVDGAFPHVSEVTGGGREVTVVVEHHEVMMCGGSADQQVHG
jgi:hypothetical protein